MQTNATITRAGPECKNAADELGAQRVPLLFGKKEPPEMTACNRAHSIETSIKAATKTITEVQKENVDAD